MTQTLYYPEDWKAISSTQFKELQARYTCRVDLWPGGCYLQVCHEGQRFALKLDTGKCFADPKYLV